MRSGATNILAGGPATERAVDEPEGHPDREQDARPQVDASRVLRQHPEADECSEHRDERRCHVVVVVDVVRSEDEHGDVDDREHRQQQHDGRVRQRIEVARQHERGGEDRGEHDRRERRLPPGRHPAQHRRHDTLFGHAVDQPRGHDHVDQRPVEQREQRDRFHERKAEHGHGEDLAPRRRVAADRLNEGGKNVADTDTGADHAGDMFIREKPVHSGDGCGIAVNRKI